MNFQRRAIVSSLFLAGLGLAIMGLSREKISEGEGQRFNAAPLPSSTRAPASLSRNLTLRREGRKEVVAAKAMVGASPAEVTGYVAGLAAVGEDPDPESLQAALRSQGFHVSERRAGNPRTGERIELDASHMAGEAHAIFDIHVDGTVRFSSLRVSLEASDFGGLVASARESVGEKAKVVRRDADVVRWELPNEKAFFVKRVRNELGRETVLMTTEYIVGD